VPVNLENLLRQAATCIDPKKDKGAYAYMIGEEAYRAGADFARQHSPAKDD